MSVFQNLDCLSLVVCINTTLLKLQTVLFLFFSKFCASKSGVRLIHGRLRYSHYSNNYSYSGLIPNEGALRLLYQKFNNHCSSQNSESLDSDIF